MTPISPETRQFINEHQSDDVRNLALQARKYPDVDIPAAITQIAGRQIAAEKIPSWKEIDDIWYPKHLSLEQCSSEITARYKASLLQGESLADLTGGFGIDCSFLATGFRSATYVERQTELCAIAAHNFPALDLNHIRKRIDEIDDGILDLFLQRMQCIHEVSACKKAHKLPILDRKREREKLTYIASQTPAELKSSSLVLFSLLMETARTSEHLQLQASSQSMHTRIDQAQAHTGALFPTDALIACQGVGRLFATRRRSPF